MKASNHDLRVFLGLWAGIFALFLAWGFFKNGALREWAAAGVFVSLALMLAPKSAVPFYKAWLKVGDAVGFVISRSILALLFFGIFTPLALIFKIIGRDILGQNRAFKTREKSFFIARENQPTTMKNQF